MTDVRDRRSFSFRVLYAQDLTSDSSLHLSISKESFHVKSLVLSSNSTVKIHRRSLEGISIY